MNFNLKKYSSTLIFSYLLCLLGFFFVDKMVAINFLSFTIFFLLFIFFPAHFFAKKLIPAKLTRLESFVFGYVITEVFLFATQWGFNLVHLKYGIWSFLTFTILGFKALRDNKESVPMSNETSSLRLSLSLLYLAFLTLFFIMYFFIEIPAFHPDRITTIYPDQLWNVGNTWSIIRGIFPTIDSRFAGQILGYHLIQSYLHATFSIVSNIHPLLIQNYYFSIVDAFFMVFTIGLGAKRFLRWNDRIILSVIFLLLFTKGIGWYYHGHLFANPLTFFHSLTALSLFLITMLSYFKNKDFRILQVSLFAFIVMVGAKATLAILFLPTLFLIFCYKLIFKKENADALKKELLFGIGLLLACIALKFMIFLHSRPLLINQGGSYSSVFNFLTHRFASLPSWAINTLFLVYLTLKQSMFYFTNPQGILFGVGILLVLSKRKFKEYLDGQAVFLLISIGLCVIFENVLRYNGSDGEIYFSWYGIIIVIFLFGHLYNFMENLQPKKINTSYLQILALSIGFILFIIPFYKSYPWKHWFSNETQAHIGATTTYDEIEAMKWVNKNVKENELIFSDRRAFPKNKFDPNAAIIERFFAYSALSGKQFLIEGDSFNCCEDLIRSKDNWNRVNQFIATDDFKVSSDLLKSFNADYFIQSLRFNKKDFSHNPKLQLVYSNNDVNIFKIKKD